MHLQENIHTNCIFGQKCAMLNKMYPCSITPPPNINNGYTFGYLSEAILCFEKSGDKILPIRHKASM